MASAPPNTIPTHSTSAYRSLGRMSGLRPAFGFTIHGRHTDQVLAHLQQAIPDTRPPGSVRWGQGQTHTHEPTPSQHHIHQGVQPAVRVRWAGPHAIVALPDHERRLWSPWLFIEVETYQMSSDDTDNAANNNVSMRPTGVRITGRLSPAPGLWVGYALFLIAASAVAGLGLCITVAQWTIGTQIWGWWLVLVAGLFAVTLLSIAVIGQRATRTQMDRLQTLLEDAVKPLHVD